MYTISSNTSFLFKYILPNATLVFFCVFGYACVKSGDLIGQYFSGTAVVYISLMNILILRKISVYVAVDAAARTIIAGKSGADNPKTVRWDELVQVYNFLNFYTVLKFDTGLKIRFRPKKYVPLLEEDDAKDVIQLLKRLALKNKIRQAV